MGWPTVSKQIWDWRRVADDTFDQREIFIEPNQTGIRDLGFHVLALSSKIKKCNLSADADTKGYFLL